jgi:hypothetical protein
MSLPPKHLPINEQGKEIATVVHQVQNRAEDVALVQDTGFEVDDDNDPTPKNVPTLFNAPAGANGGELFEGQEWGWDSIGRQAIVQGLMYNRPTFSNEWSPNKKIYIKIFMHLFPINFLKETILNATSNTLLTENAVHVTLESCCCTSG